MHGVDSNLDSVVISVVCFRSAKSQIEKSIREVYSWQNGLPTLEIHRLDSREYASFVGYGLSKGMLAV